MIKNPIDFPDFINPVFVIMKIWVNIPKERYSIWQGCKDDKRYPFINNFDRQLQLNGLNKNLIGFPDNINPVLVILKMWVNMPKERDSVWQVSKAIERYPPIIKKNNSIDFFCIILLLPYIASNRNVLL